MGDEKKAPGRNPDLSALIDWTYVTREVEGQMTIVEVPLAKAQEKRPPSHASRLGSDFGDQLAHVFAAAVERARQNAR